MTSKIHPGATVKLTKSGMPGTVKAVLRNGRFLVTFEGGFNAWFSGWEKSHFSGVQS